MWTIVDLIDFPLETRKFVQSGTNIFFCTVFQREKMMYRRRIDNTPAAALPRRGAEAFGGKDRGFSPAPVVYTIKILIVGDRLKRRPVGAEPTRALSTYHD